MTSRSCQKRRFIASSISGRDSNVAVGFGLSLPWTSGGFGVGCDGAGAGCDGAGGSPHATARPARMALKRAGTVMRPVVDVASDDAQRLVAGATQRIGTERCSARVVSILADGERWASASARRLVPRLYPQVPRSMWERWRPSSRQVGRCSTTSLVSSPIRSKASRPFLPDACSSKTESGTSATVSPGLPALRRAHLLVLPLGSDSRS